TCPWVAWGCGKVHACLRASPTSNSPASSAPSASPLRSSAISLAGNASLIEPAVIYSHGGAPRQRYCGAWYPFGDRPLWIVLGLMPGPLMIYAFVKLTSL